MDARDIIAKALQSALKGEGGIRDVPQTCLADAILAALAANQLAVVGREPTQRMIDRGTASNNYDGDVPSAAPPDHDYDDDFRRVWRAMFDAISPSPVSTGDRR